MLRTIGLLKFLILFGLFFTFDVDTFNVQFTFSLSVIIIQLLYFKDIENVGWY